MVKHKSKIAKISLNLDELRRSLADKNNMKFIQVDNEIIVPELKKKIGKSKRRDIVF